MSWYGMAFLEASVGPSIRRLCAEKVAIEVDPVRIGKGGRAVEKNVELLVTWCTEFWDRIYDARRQCPPYVFQTCMHCATANSHRLYAGNSADYLNTFGD